MKSDAKLLVFMKDNYWTNLAEKYIRANFEDPIIIMGSGKGFPDEFAYRIRYEKLDVDWVISYLSHWILPPKILALGKKGAINFHPGPPEYPGIGCYNFAILDEVKTYGVTCHFMYEKVDTGPIIKVLKFEITGNETVEQLKNISMIRLLTLFYEIMGRIWQGKTLEANGLGWSKKPFTRADLQNITDLTPFEAGTFAEALFDKALRATYFPGAEDPPFINVKGRMWRLEPL